MLDHLSTAHVASPIQAYLEHLHRQFSGLTEGEVASYIPELAKAVPASFGIVIATACGQLYEIGDTRQAFTIQSISKPLVYGIALEDRGRAQVERRIGVEPTGDAFNSISLEPGTGRPLNPMVNAGAIAASAMVAGATREARLARVVEALSAYAGRPLAIDDAVFESERSTGHRNRAIGHMLRNHGVIEDDPEPALELYFKQCAVLVDCRDLALIAATLANDGVNPITRQRAVPAELIGPILSVMTSCGMYDFAGEWIYRVGMPAKSGVGGGIIAALPGQLGIGVFSPPLDARGNSVRGVQVCEAMSRDLALHFLRPPQLTAATVRARYTLASVRSKRRRPADERAVLDAHGHRATVVELQGDLRFSSIEPVLRDIAEADADQAFAVLDFKRVVHVDAAATRLLAQLVDGCAARGQHLVLTRVRRGEMLAGFGEALNPRSALAVSFQPQLDLGLEWCERGLLKQHAAVHPASSSAVNSAVNGSAGLTALADHRLCAGVSADDLDYLESRVDRCAFEAGATILRRGSPADALYFLMRGEVSVIVELEPGGFKRLATLSPGMGFGEAALLASGVRSADVRADTAVECCTLGAPAFARLEHERPGLMIKLLFNLLRGSTETAVRLTKEVAALEG